MFAPFASRDFRVLWLAIFLRSGALWLDQAARPLLIAELTGSAFLLGVVLAVRMAPNLILGLFAGAVVDRYSRRLDPGAVAGRKCGGIRSAVCAPAV